MDSIVLFQLRCTAHPLHFELLLLLLSYITIVIGWSLLDFRESVGPYVLLSLEGVDSKNRFIAILECTFSTI